jgi:hypothetical protein
MIFAFMRKSPFYEKALAGEEFGLFNGYVAFSEKLPVSWQSSWDEENTIDDFIHPHGGITFDRTIGPDMEMIPLTEIPDPELWKDGIRCIGFDTAHIDDNAERWNFESVREETLNMLSQVKALIDSR